MLTILLLKNPVYTSQKKCIALMAASYTTLQLLMKQVQECQATMSIVKCSSTEQNITRCTDRKHFDYTAKSNKDRYHFAYKVIAGFKEQTKALKRTREKHFCEDRKSI